MYTRVMYKPKTSKIEDILSILENVGRSEGELNWDNATLHGYDNNYLKGLEREGVIETSMLQGAKFVRLIQNNG